MRRSDFVRSELRTNFRPSKSDYLRNIQHLNSNNDDDSDEIHTTTENNAEYLSQDTESVDRLALDGETRDATSGSYGSSSTINSFNF